MDDKMAQWTMAASMLGVNRRLEAWKWPGGSVRMPRVAGYDVVRVILGLVLLTAAGLKGYQLATEPTLEKGLFTSRWFLIGQVEFELALGIFLLSGLYKRLVWLVTLVCFVGFSCVTLYKGLSGEASCGCFGKVEISPWYTSLIDLSAIVGLTALRPKCSWIPMGFRRAKLVMPMILVLVLGLPSGYAMATYQPVTLTESGVIQGKSDFIVLEPGDWTGKRFPLLDHIDIGNSIREGTWITILFRQDCPECAERVPKCVQMLKELNSGCNIANAALIEVPSFNKIDPEVSHFDAAFAIGRLPQTYYWIVATPTMILSQNGVVKGVWQREIPDIETIFRTLGR